MRKIRILLSKIGAVIWKVTFPKTRAKIRQKISLWLDKYPRTKKWIKRILKWSKRLFWTGVVIGILLILLFCILYIPTAMDLVAKGLPSTQYSMATGKVYTVDAVGKKELGEQDTMGVIPQQLRDGRPAKRLPVELKNVPKTLKDGIVAVEDAQFYRHPGFNPWRMLVALIKNIFHLAFKEGASTITQQLARNTYLDAQKHGRRKLMEIAIAIVLEFRCTKDQLLEMFINQAPLGQDGKYAIIGFGQEAMSDFGHGLALTTLDEHAIMIGKLKANTDYSLANPEECKKRRDQVLDIMVGEGVLDPILANEAKEKSIPPARGPNLEIGWGEDGYPVQHGLALMPSMIPEKTAASEYNVYLTIDRGAQDAAVTAIQTTLPGIEKRVKKCEVKKDGKVIEHQNLQVALVALDATTGAVLAEIGGRSLDGIHRAAETKRQVGSAFKPFAYAAAVDEIGPELLQEYIKDAPLDEIEGYTLAYKPGNYGGTYSREMMTVRENLIHSLNSGMMQVASMRLGNLKPIADLAARAGIKQSRFDWTMPLGTNEQTPLAMASAYTAFARGGNRISPKIIRRITDAQGKVIYDWAPEVGVNSVMKPETASVISEALQDVIVRGTAAKIGVRLKGWPIAGKTGTTGEYHDGVFVGFTFGVKVKVVVYVWVGFDKRCHLGLTGGDSAGLIWEAFMVALRKVHPDWFQAPPPVVPTAEATPSPSPAASPSPSPSPSDEQANPVGEEPTRIETPAVTNPPTSSSAPKSVPDPSPTATPKSRAVGDVNRNLRGVLEGGSSPASPDTPKPGATPKKPD